MKKKEDVEETGGEQSLLCFYRYSRWMGNDCCHKTIDFMMPRVLCVQ